jgi:hypothetical protein
VISLAISAQKEATLGRVERPTSASAALRSIH